MSIFRVFFQFRAYSNLVMVFLWRGAVCPHIKLRKQFNIIDAHFAYPNGYAATLLGKWLEFRLPLPCGATEAPLSKMPGRKARLLTALKNATRVFSVSDSLKQLVVSLGAESGKIRVIGNGIDVVKVLSACQNRCKGGIEYTRECKGINFCPGAG